MNLRTAAVTALGLYAIAQAMPACKFFTSNAAAHGWEVTLFSGQISFGVLMTPSNLEGLLFGGAAARDRLVVMSCISGASANLLLLLAIGSAFRKSPTATLLLASAATAASAGCLMILLSDGGFTPLVGCGLWTGSMLWLSVTAAATVWRNEFGRCDPLRVAQSRPRTAACDRLTIPNID